MWPDIAVANYNDVTCVVWLGPGILNCSYGKKTRIDNSMFTSLQGAQTRTDRAVSGAAVL